METLTITPSTFGEHLERTTIGVHEGDIARALRVLQETALPTTRTEAWKYTRVAKLGKMAFSNRKETISNVEAYLIDLNAPRLVFVNGHFSAELSSKLQELDIECRILDARSELEPITLPLEGEVFNALNTAYLHGGCVVTIAPNSQIKQTLQVIHIVKGGQVVSNFKTLIHVGKNAKASIVQSFFSEGEGANFCNSSTEISVGENAHFTLEKLQYEGGENFHISSEIVAQEKNSQCTINTITLNGGLVRNNIYVHVNGENCTSNLNGAYLLKERQHVDNHTVIDHKVAHCDSNELYKGVIDDQATAVFNGKVFVRPDAQKINAFQSNGNVLVSNDASVNSKPELEIYADDVKCSHGSTTGQLDEEAIYYLRARGISEKSARRLMVAAFVGDVLEKIENPSLLTYTEKLLEERFHWTV